MLLATYGTPLRMNNVTFFYYDLKKKILLLMTTTLSIFTLSFDKLCSN